MVYVSESREGSMKFASIIVDISHEKLDKTFQYIIPEELEDQVEVGNLVTVPFGKSNREIRGYVVEIGDEPVMAPEKLKYLNAVEEKNIKIESVLITLAGFIKERYGCTMSKALKTVIPVKESVEDKVNRYLSLAVPREEALNLYEKYNSRKNTAGRAKLIYELTKADEIEWSAVVSKMAVSEAVIRGLEKSGIIKITRSTIFRNPVGHYEQDEKKLELNDEQKQVVEGITGDIDKGNRKPKLIFGVTGSGKTEVYMEIIEHVIRQGKEVIVLIPEISLTFQTIKRFYKRFGDIVSIINSKLSKGERYDQFRRASEGDIQIMIGPRSALFTPFKNLGLIIIDEEHEGAYKSDSVPKYHARDVAIKRAEISDAVVVLGSATPAVSTYYRAENGTYDLYRLTKRANNLSLPKVEIVDMREELEQGNRDIFSERLKELVRDRLEKKEQMMLFINRRGYSSFISCRKCGTPMKCPHCDVGLTLHRRRGGDKLICHYCGYQAYAPNTCPVCGSKYIGKFGIGTEQVVEKVKQEFPQARILRMDFDTTRGKGDYEEILSSFEQYEADILVGTQMIVKGHDFSNVTLVGILAADLSMFSADYMAAERTFELLTQAAGRAGRGEKAGEVVIQTYNPEENCIVCAAKQDYENFYKNEIEYRELMTYPPVYDMMAILVTDKNEKFADYAIADIAKRIENSKIQGLRLIGPSKASISKINDVYRNVIYIKHPDAKILIKVKNAILRYLDMVEQYKNLQIQFDFNPMNVY